MFDTSKIKVYGFVGPSGTGKSYKIGRAHV